MKIGFSSLVCPAWDLATILEKASEYGFEGVELRGLQGELYLPRVPAVAGNPAVTRQRFSAAGIELVCLGSSVTLSARKPAVLAKARIELQEYIDLAASLGCPYVRMFAGEVQAGETQEATLGRVAEELTRMAAYAASKRVAIVVENGGDFADSRALWYLCDCASHPAIRVCWNPCTAMLVNERPTISIPRLGTRIGLAHVCDGRFEGGHMEAYAVPGEGTVELSRMIDLLKGIVYRDYLIFEWPKMWDTSLPGPDAVLPKVKAYLRERVDEKQPILTAYKGDKNPTKMMAVPAKSSARA
ncbi:MAG: sugar phosphate isomerase/epimerase [Phycisphaerales bacterium]|nr:sugar phosphate isomerase/epimerase [Phycisphaerales bacterium]